MKPTKPAPNDLIARELLAKIIKYDARICALRKRTKAQDRRHTEISEALKLLR